MHPNWTGGRHAHNDGYVRVYSPENPSASARGYALEHRLVMERVLGRSLGTDETVHHINGIRSDNRPENLELWVTSQPAGQRPRDLVKWATEILRRYGTGVTIA